MVQLIEDTEEESVYYHYIFNHYIRCTKTRAFPYKTHEQWPADEKSSRMEARERKRRDKLKQGGHLDRF